MKTNIHEIIIKKELFDILSADTAFYEFTEGRLYYTFDELIFSEDLNIFKEHCNNMYDKSFLLRLNDNYNKTVLFYATLGSTGDDNEILINLFRLDSLVEENNVLNRQLDVKNSILSLYNDIFFEYTPDNDIIKIYSLDKVLHSVREYQVSDLENSIPDTTAEKDKKILTDFLNDIRLGARQFSLQTNADFFNVMKNSSEITIEGVSLYDNGAFKIAAGYIHCGVKATHNTRKQLEMDSLTGVLPKAEITNLAISLIDGRRTNNVTIAIVDIDHFKNVNDTYGHMCGDEILKKVAGIIQKQVGSHGVVGRIGGDEFFIIYTFDYNKELVRDHLRSMKNIVNTMFPENDNGNPSITLSIGCATFPNDADNYEDLFTLADFTLYRAKENGRNRYVIYVPEKHGTLEEIKSKKMTGKKRIDNRGDMSMGDILCIMMDKVYKGADYPLDKLLDDFVVNFKIQRIMIYAATPDYHITWMAGEKRPSKTIIAETEHYISYSAYQNYFDTNGMLLVNNISYFETKQPAIYSMLKKQGILSLLQLKFTDKNGVPAVLSLESVSRKISWSSSFTHYYRLFAKLLSEYDVTMLI